MASLDGRAPGWLFLRVVAVDEAGNLSALGRLDRATLPIRVPDVRRPLAVIDDDRPSGSCGMRQTQMFPNRGFIALSCQPYRNLTCAT